MVYFFTMKHMNTMNKKRQYLHALHRENKKHLLLKNFIFPIQGTDDLPYNYLNHILESLVILIIMLLMIHDN
jgi:hypothetical protein